jgi:hypothetical protein
VMKWTKEAKEKRTMTSPQGVYGGGASRSPSSVETVGA